MSDARFEDGMDKPLRLIAFDAEDLQVLSTMTQDAVWQGEQMTWLSISPCIWEHSDRFWSFTERISFTFCVISRC